MGIGLATQSGSPVGLATVFFAFFLAFVLKKKTEDGGMLCGGLVVGILGAILAIVAAILCLMGALALSLYAAICAEIDDGSAEVGDICDQLGIMAFVFYALAAVNLVMAVSFIGGACVANKLKAEISANGGPAEAAPAQAS